jgi:predicted nucleic acid-binding Zn ribbon protein
MLSQAPKSQAPECAGNAYPASLFQCYRRLLQALPKLLKWFGPTGSTDITTTIAAPSIVPSSAATMPHFGVVAECALCNRHRRRYEDATCVVCQRPFFPKLSSARTCSGACRQKLYRDRKRAAKAAEALERGQA